MSEINWLSWRFEAFPYLLIFRISLSFLSAQITAQVLVQKIPLDLLSKRRLEIEISFRFISCLFLIPLAQSQQISSFDFVETNMFDCFRRIAPLSSKLANDVIPFLARDANENLASETSRPFATSSVAHPLRVRKITIRSQKHFLLGLSWGRLVASLGSAVNMTLNSSIHRWKLY